MSIDKTNIGTDLPFNEIDIVSNDHKRLANYLLQLVSTLQDRFIKLEDLSNLILDIENTDVKYYGTPDKNGIYPDGTWRIIRQSNDIFCQKKTGGNWVTINKLIDHDIVFILAGDGLAGGGSIVANRTLTNADKGSTAITEHQSAFNHNLLHNPLTIENTASIILTLVGQKISGVVLASGVAHDFTAGVHQNVNTSATPIFAALSVGPITGTLFNALTLTALSTGFSIAGGTTSKTLTVLLDGSVSGINTGDQTSVSGNAGSATTTAITNDTTTNATMYPTWVTGTSGNLAQKISSTKLFFNPAQTRLTVIGEIAAAVGIFTSITGNTISNTVGIQTDGYLDVSTTSTFNGKATFLGGIDPPYILLDKQTQEQFLARYNFEVPQVKMGGIALWWDGEKLYGFTSSDGQTGNLYEIQMKKAGSLTIPNTFNTTYEKRYYFDTITGEIKETQIAKSDRYVIKTGYKLDRETGEFKDKEGKLVDKSLAVELTK